MSKDEIQFVEDESEDEFQYFIKCEDCKLELNEIQFVEEYDNCFNCRSKERETYKRNKCNYEGCKKRKAAFNYEEFCYGIRCKPHILKGMVNVKESFKKI